MLREEADLAGRRRSQLEGQSVDLDRPRRLVSADPAAVPVETRSAAAHRRQPTRDPSAPAPADRPRGPNRSRPADSSPHVDELISSRTVHRVS